MNPKAQMKRIRLASLLVFFGSLVLVLTFLARSETNVAQVEQNSSPAYLGFDANDYPGDAMLLDLRKAFAFSGYWLNVPPGAKANPWTGKRDVLIKNGFGFLVLFNGRLAKELKSPADPSDLGTRDAELAVVAARRDGFPANGSVVIYLDIEEGGRMIPTQISYIQSWSSGINSKGFVAGVYCSGIKVKEGKAQTITTADNIHQNVPIINAYFVYDDECPPSPGCVIWKNPPPPSQSGFSSARVWQFAQSPRRRNLTSRCSATYSPGGNCYPPAHAGANYMLLDLDVSVTPDPSTLARRPLH